jgi:hypothetical protein
MAERRLSVDDTTIYRWVQRYAPGIEKRCRPHLKTTTDSWRVDETDVKVKGVWMELTAWQTLQGYEGINMMRKGQRKGDSLRQATFIAALFGVAI